MATRQYIGARYVPKFYENSVDGSTQWQANVVYDPLIWVTLQNGHMYISKKQVPATVGTPAENIDYWLDIGNYNGILSDLQDQIDLLKNYVTPQMFGAAANGTTNDTQAVRDALAYLSGKGGGVLFFPAGNYAIKPLGIISDTSDSYYYGCINIPANVLVLGYGANLLGDTTTSGSIYDAANRNKTIFCTSSNNVVIRGLTLNGGYCGVVTRENNDVVIEDVEIKNMSLDGIYVGTPGSSGVNVTDLTIRGCHIDAAHRNGISFLRCHDAIIDGNVIENVDTAGNAPGCGIDLEPEVNATIENVIISNNVIKSNVYGVQLYGDAVGDVDNIKIINNDIHGNSTREINSEFTSNCLVENNKIENSSVQLPVYFYKGDNIRVVRNAIKGCVYLMTNNSEVSFNVLKDSLTHGIYIDRIVGSYESNNSIIGNTVKGADKHGIFVQYGYFTSVKDNKVIDANTGNHSDLNACGIACYTICDSTIKDNQIISQNKTVNAPIYIPDSTSKYTVIKDNISRGTSNAYILYGAASCVAADNLVDVGA